MPFALVIIPSFGHGVLASRTKAALVSKCNLLGWLTQPSSMALTELFSATIGAWLGVGAWIGSLLGAEAGVRVAPLA